MINDLIVENARLWKYVDDTTISESVAKGSLAKPNVLQQVIGSWLQIE